MTSSGNPTPSSTALRPSVPARLGLDPDSLHAINPKLTVAQLIGLHDEPPYSEAPAFDLVIQAMAGIMSVTGERGGAPVRVGYQVADLAGGLYLALGCVGGMLKSLKSGKGEHVQISLLDCQLALADLAGAELFHLGRRAGRQRRAASGHRAERHLSLRGRKVHGDLADRPAVLEEVLRRDRPARHGRRSALRSSQEAAWRMSAR